VEWVEYTRSRHCLWSALHTRCEGTEQADPSGGRIVDRAFHSWTSCWRSHRWIHLYFRNNVLLWFLRQRRRRVTATAPTETRYHISRRSPHVELPGALHRSYSSISFARLAPGYSPDISHYNGISSASPPSRQGRWPGTDRLAQTSHTRGIGELGSLKGQVLLIPIYELPTVRSPLEMGFSK
jgi:hypothetical protein